MNIAFKLIFVQDGKRRWALFVSEAEARKAKTYFQEKRKWEAEEPKEVSYDRNDGQRHTTAYGFLTMLGYLGTISRHNTAGGPQRI